jgi:RNA polymerase sigma-70 factor (ECF subfamily)
MNLQEDFETLFRDEYPSLVRELRLILGDVDLAEEVAAEAFVACWRNWSDVSTFDRPGAWVRKVALRQAGRRRWRRGRRAAVEGSHLGPGVIEQPLDMDLIEALLHLSQPQRVAIVLHHLGGWPAIDIAVVLSCAEPTVRSHLSRGRQRLADLLEPTDDPLEVSDASTR